MINGSWPLILEKMFDLFGQLFASEEQRACKVRLAHLAQKHHEPSSEPDNYLFGQFAGYLAASAQHNCPSATHEHGLDANLDQLRSRQLRGSYFKLGIGCACPDEIEPDHIAGSQILHKEGCLSSYIEVNSPGLGLELNCLEQFIDAVRQTPDARCDQEHANDPLRLDSQVQPPGGGGNGPREGGHLRATVKDLPCIKPDFKPIDKRSQAKCPEK